MDVIAKINKIAPIDPVIANKLPNQLAIKVLNPEFVNVIDKPLATAIMNATPIKSLQPS
jgi:hypothetical protein